jgi:hypothetical protein
VAYESQPEAAFPDEKKSTPNAPAARNWPNLIASLEECAVERVSGKAGFRIVRRDACVLDSIVRDQIRQSVVIYVSKVILERPRFREIV